MTQIYCLFRGTQTDYEGRATIVGLPVPGFVLRDHQGFDLLDSWV